ncbi:hypothetical protein COOONC_06354 [Cooperia oncophora]
MVAAADMEVMDVPDDAEGDEDIEVLEEGQEDSVQHIELLSDEDVSEQSMDDFDEDEGCNASGGSGAVSASTPKRLSFDSPVRFQNPPTVTTSADTISGSSTHTGVTQSASTSSAPPVSLASQVPKLFKSSVEPAFSSTQASSTPIVEDSSSENRSDSASQESTPAIQVSGSGEVRRDVNDDDGAGHNDSAGESRDSGSGMPVSSSDGRRKRSATNESSSCESKRHRDSPSEVVTSSEERRDLDVIPESGMVAAADMEVMDVPDDAEGDEDIEVLEEGQEDSVQHIELLSDEDVSEQSMDDFDEDEDDGGMESDEEIDNGDSADVVVLSDGEDDAEIGEVEMEDDHGDDELDDGDGLVVGQDDEALAADAIHIDATLLIPGELC